MLERTRVTVGRNRTRWTLGPALQFPWLCPFTRPCLPFAHSAFGDWCAVARGAVGVGQGAHRRPCARPPCRSMRPAPCLRCAAIQAVCQDRGVREVRGVHGCGLVVRGAVEMGQGAHRDDRDRRHPTLPRASLGLRELSPRSIVGSCSPRKIQSQRRILVRELVFTNRRFVDVKTPVSRSAAEGSAGVHGPGWAQRDPGRPRGGLGPESATPAISGETSMRAPGTKGTSTSGTLR